MVGSYKGNISDGDKGKIVVYFLLINFFCIWLCYFIVNIISILMKYFYYLKVYDSFILS